MYFFGTCIRGTPIYRKVENIKQEEINKIIWGTEGIYFKRRNALMKCPYCNEEMEQGYIQCRGGVYWSNKKRAVSALPPVTGKSINLSEYNISLSGPYVIAYNCSKCKKIIIDYGENE